MLTTLFHIQKAVKRLRKTFAHFVQSAISAGAISSQNKKSFCNKLIPTITLAVKIVAG